MAFILIPTKNAFNLMTISLVLVPYLVNVVIFFMIKKKKNYFDFDTIFLTTCSIEHLSVPFLYDTEIFDRLFYMGLDNRLFLKGTLLGAVGLVAYMLGSVYADNINMKANCGKVSGNVIVTGRNYFHPLVAPVMCLICFAIFTGAGGLMFYQSEYMYGVGQGDSNSLIFQSLTLMVTFSCLFCLNIFQRGTKLSVVEMILLGLIIIASLQIMMVGNRTACSYILLPYIMCYAAYKRNLNLAEASIMLIAASFVMYVIQITRGGGTVSSVDFIMIFSDIIFPARVFYGSLEYVDAQGLNWGLSMLPPLIGIFPGLSSFLGRWTTNGSAELMTRYLYSDNDSGLGTTIVADIYLSFGVLGVALLLFFLGLQVNKRRKNLRTQLIYSICFFSSCIFMIRSSYFLPLRQIVWLFVISKILHVLYKRRNVEQVNENRFL